MGEVIDKLLMICPSRGRPDKLARMLKTWRETTFGYSDIIVVLDSDDESPYPVEKDVTYIVEERRNTPRTINEHVMSRIDNYVGMAFTADDIRYRTKGWDKTIVETIKKANSWAFVYGNDGYHDNTLGTHPAMGAKLVKALGWVHREEFHHLFQDLILRDVMGRVGNVSYYLPDVIIEHMHPTAGKGVLDSTYAAYWNKEAYEHDSSLYHGLSESQIDEWANKIKRAMHENS